MQAGCCLCTVMLALLCCSHQTLAGGEVVRWGEHIWALVRSLNTSFNLARVLGFMYAIVRYTVVEQGT